MLNLSFNQTYQDVQSKSDFNTQFESIAARIPGCTLRLIMVRVRKFKLIPLVHFNWPRRCPHLHVGFRILGALIFSNFLFRRFVYRWWCAWLRDGSHNDIPCIIVGSMAHSLWPSKNNMHSISVQAYGQRPSSECHSYLYIVYLHIPITRIALEQGKDVGKVGKVR